MACMNMMQSKFMRQKVRMTYLLIRNQKKKKFDSDFFKEKNMSFFTGREKYKVLFKGKKYKIKSRIQY